MQRDHSIIPVFDGNSAVNLQYVISQLRQLTFTPTLGDRTEDMAKQLFDLEAHLPQLDFNRLKLSNQRKDFIKNALWNASLKLESLPFQTIHTEELATITQALIESWEKLDEAILGDKSNITNSLSIPEKYFEYAKHFANLHLASACLNLWLYNSNKTGSGLFAEGWIVLVLRRIAERIGLTLKKDGPDLTQWAIESLIQMVDNDQLISIIPKKII